MGGYQPTPEEIIAAFYGPAGKPEGAGAGRILIHTRFGDPRAGKGWPVKVAEPWHFERKENIYLTLATFVRASYKNDKGIERVGYVRRKSHFDSMRVILMDDLGDGIGSKHPLTRLKLDPSILIETSPGNFSAYYILAQPERDKSKVDGLVNGLIRQGLLSDKDPGMRGVTRVSRPGYGINGKPAYAVAGKAWQVCTTVWHPDLHYTMEQIAEAYGIDLTHISEPEPRGPPSVEALDEFKMAVAMLDYLGAFWNGGKELLSAEWDPALPMVSINCPFWEEHSDGDDGKPDPTGCGIRPYSPADGKGPMIWCNHGDGTKYYYRHYITKIAEQFTERRQKDRAAQDAEQIEREREAVRNAVAGAEKLDAARRIRFFIHGSLEDQQNAVGDAALAKINADAGAFEEWVTPEKLSLEDIEWF